MQLSGSSRDWTMWGAIPRIALVHAALRQHLLVSGVRDHWFETPMGTRGHAYLAGRATDGPPVVLVHGLGDSAHTWFRTIPRLAAAGHRVLAVELYGHGRTSLPGSRDYATVREQTGLLEAAAHDAFGAQPVAVVGHSLGGWVAAKAAARGDSPLSRLVLVESAGLPYDGIERELALLRVQCEADVAKLWQTACHKVPWELRLFHRDVAQLFSLPTVKAFVDADHSEDAITEAEARRIRTPTTLIWGECDGLVPPEVGERLARIIPESDLHWIPSCGHAPQLEAPRHFHRLILRALSDAEGRAA